MEGGIIGTGCPTTVVGLPVHNPEPSTARGKRRFAALEPKQQEQRRARWNIGRSTRPSKMQKKMMESRGHGGY